MRPPLGFRTSFPGQVWQVKKSIYGFRQTPRCWFSKLTAAFCECSFSQSYPYYSFLTYHRNNVVMCVLIYVYDLLITRNSLSSASKLMDYLSSCFYKNTWVHSNIFWGLKLHKTLRVYICSNGNTLWKLFLRPASNPLEPNHQLGKALRPLFDKSNHYGRLLGKLIYLTLTRPELKGEY